jgi:hypothetical protein
MSGLFGKGKGLAFRLCAVLTLVIGSFAATTETKLDDRALAAVETAGKLIPRDASDKEFVETLEGAKVSIDATKASVTGLIAILFTLAAQLFGDRAYTARVEERVERLEDNR